MLPPVSRRLVVSSVLALVALTLADCGGGGEGTSTNAATTSTSSSPSSASSAPVVYAGLLKVKRDPAAGGGVVVLGLEKGSPFDAAGLQSGDVIVALDGRGVDGPDALRAEVAKLSDAHVAGDAVDLAVKRGGEKQTLKLVLAPNTYLGAEVTTGTAGRPGVVVQSTHPGSPAAKALKRADVITAVDGERVHDVDELFTALGAHAPGDEVTLSLIRSANAREMDVKLKLAPRPGTT